MLEYDQNLPQELSARPKRVGTGTMIIILVSATILLVYALVVGLPFISHHQI